MANVRTTEDFKATWVQIEEPDQYGAFRIDIESEDPANDENFMALFRDVEADVKAAITAAAAATDNPVEKELIEELKPSKLISKYQGKSGTVKHRIRFKSKSQGDGDSIPVLGPDILPSNLKAFAGDTIRVGFEPRIWLMHGNAGISLDLMGVIMIKKAENRPTAKKVNRMAAMTENKSVLSVEKSVDDDELSF